jgi:hypothetical protein
MRFDALGQKLRVRSAIVSASLRSVRQLSLNFLIFLAEKERIKLKAIDSNRWMIDGSTRSAICDRSLCSAFGS